MESDEAEAQRSLRRSGIIATNREQEQDQDFIGPRGRTQRLKKNDELNRRGIYRLPEEKSRAI